MQCKAYMPGVTCQGLALVAAAIKLACSHGLLALLPKREKGVLAGDRKRLCGIRSRNI